MKAIDRKIIVMAAAAWALAACNSTDDNSLDVSGLQPEIQIVPIVEGSTRALQTGSDLSLETGDKFYVWADQRDPTGDDEDNPIYVRSNFFDEWELAVQAGVNRIAASRETKRYPAMNRVQFYAIHGNFSGEHSSINGNDDIKCKFPLTKTEFEEQFDQYNPPTAEDLGPLLHSVENDQRTDGEGLNTNYTKSDLLYGIVPEMPASNSAVPLHFYHMLSKVVVNLMLGKGLTTAQLSTATVRIVNVKTKVMFSPKKLKFMDGAVASDDNYGVWMMDEASELGTLSGRESMLSELDDAESTNPPTQTIMLGTNVNQSEVCILPPQTFTEDAAIEITWNNTTKQVPLTGTIRSGMVYTYDVTVDHIGIGYNFAPTVTAWGASGQREIDVTQ